MLHVLLVWILDTLYQIDYSFSTKQSGSILFSALHAYLLMLRSNDAEYQFKV